MSNVKVLKKESLAYLKKLNNLGVTPQEIVMEFYYNAFLGLATSGIKKEMMIPQLDMLRDVCMTNYDSVIKNYRKLAN